MACVTSSACLFSCQEVEARNEMSFSHFTQFYKNLMFDAQKSVRGPDLQGLCPPSASRCIQM